MKAGVSYMMNWLHRFFSGRYGNDSLNVALLVLSVVILLIAQLTGAGFVTFIAYVPLVLCLLRSFSRNISARLKEKDMFLRVWNPVKKPFVQLWHRFRDRKTFKYYSCPKCRQSLRVPKGKGRITITCPKCHERFDKMT